MLAVVAIYRVKVVCSIYGDAEPKDRCFAFLTGKIRRRNCCDRTFRNCRKNDSSNVGE